MVVKSNKSQSDDFSCWNVKKSFNNNDMEYIHDEEQSIASSVKLLLKNKNFSQPNFLQLPSHLITSPHCQCHRSFHIFCTDLYSEYDQDIDMIHIHPAPRNHERDSSRRVLSSYKKSHQNKLLEDIDYETIVTARSDPCHVTTNTDNQFLEKKLRVPPKLQPRTTSLNIPSTYRSIPNSFKSSPIIRPIKQSTSFQLKIRAISVFDQSPSTSQLFNLKGPPPSPKTPTYESSMIFLNPVSTAPFRAIPLIPQARNRIENEKKIVTTTTTTTTTSVKNTNYEDHAKEYLSSSDGSDNDDDDDKDDEARDKVLTIIKPKSPVRTQTLSRPGTSLRDRLLSHNTQRYLSLAEVYYSPSDIQKILSEKSRRPLKSQTPLPVPTTETDDASTVITKTTTTKTAPIPQSRSVFGFSKTASSMHFGHAAGRLGLHGSFEKWPQPLSRRTPIERKQEVTTLRLVTLPLVTS